jgi:hypothetical protein
MVRHLKRLICDCLSFTEGLITLLVTTETEAPAFKGVCACEDLVKRCLLFTEKLCFNAALYLLF